MTSKSFKYKSSVFSKPYKYRGRLSRLRKVVNRKRKWMGRREQMSERNRYVIN